eukprot:990651-Amphidinium_carterae.1
MQEGTNPSSSSSRAAADSPQSQAWWENLRPRQLRVAAQCERCRAATCWSLQSGGASAYPTALDNPWPVGAVLWPESYATQTE